MIQLVAALLWVNLGGRSWPDPGPACPGSHPKTPSCPTNSGAKLGSLSCGTLHYCCVLRSFADSDTERVWNRQYVSRFGPDVQRAAYRRLGRLHAAESLEDLRAIPGNRLEKLRGDRAGCHSIRVNQQWRICFRWTELGPEDVEIVDYH